jgi:hypothetical protein
MKLIPLLLVAALAGPAFAQGTAPVMPPAASAPAKKIVKHGRKQKKEKKPMATAPAVTPAPQS